MAAASGETNLNMEALNDKKRHPGHFHFEGNLGSGVQQSKDYILYDMLRVMIDKGAQMQQVQQMQQVDVIQRCLI